MYTIYVNFDVEAFIGRNSTVYAFICCAKTHSSCVYVFKMEHTPFAFLTNSVGCGLFVIYQTTDKQCLLDPYTYFMKFSLTVYHQFVHWNRVCLLWFQTVHFSSWILWRNKILYIEFLSKNKVDLIKFSILRFSIFELASRY